MLRNVFSWVIAATLLAPALQAAWTQRYEGIEEVQRSAIAPLPNGGYVIAVNGRPNAIIAVDAKGAVKAARRLDGYQPRFLTSTPTGEIYAGISESDDRVQGERFERLTKLGRDLSVVWARRLEGVDGPLMGPLHATATRDGSIVVAGSYGVGSTVVKVNGRGAVEWTMRVDPTSRDEIKSIVQTADGGYLAAGASPRWPWLIRLAADGTLLWQRGYGPLSGWFESVAELRDGTFLAMGYRASAVVLVRTDRSGEVIWSRETTATGYGFSVVPAATGAIVTMQVGSDFQVVSLALDGSVKWQRAFRPAIFMTDLFENATLASSGGQVGLTVGLALPPVIFSFDPAAGPAGCSWFSEGSLAFTAGRPFRLDKIVVELSSPELVAREAAPAALTAVELTAVPERCADAPVTPQVTSERKTLPFRSADDAVPQQRKYWELLTAGKFAELDETAAGLRRDRPSRDPMRPNLALNNFYASFIKDEFAPVETRLKHVRDWSAALPRSVTARVALAFVLYDAAWDARGGGYADTVTSTGNRTYAALSEEAARVLESVPEGREADPKYWALRIAMAGERGMGDAKKVGLRALALHPDPELANDVARFLYPQWGGNPEEYMKFADEAARATSATYGDAMYMWLVYQINNFQTSDDFRQYDVDWSRVRKGAEDLIRLKPEWLPSYHRYALLAERYDDQQTLSSLFRRPELEWYEDAERMWSARERYEWVRRKALGERETPQVAPPSPAPAIDPSPMPDPPAPPSEPSPVIPHVPPALLETELTLGADVHRNISAFLVQTPSGIVAVSALPQSLADARAAFTGWTMWAPGRARKRMRVTALPADGSPATGTAVAVRLDRAETAVKPLKLRNGKVSFSDPIFVIVCRPAKEGCKQEVVPARITAMSGSIYFIEAENLPEEVLGLPLIDARGEVFAVVTWTMARPEGGRQINAEALDAIAGR